MASALQVNEVATLSAIKSLSEPLVDGEEAARYLDIHPKTLQRMARKDEVPAYRIGKLWKFRISELDEWLRTGVTSNRHSCRENEGR